MRAATASFSDPFAVPTYSFSIPTYSYSFPTYSFSIPTYSYSFPAYSYSFPTYSYSFPIYSYSAPNYSYSYPTYSYPIPTFDPGSSSGGGSSFTSSARRRTSPRTVIGAVVGSVLGFLSILGGIWAAIKRRARRAMGKPETGTGEKPPVVVGSNVPSLGYAQPFEQAPLLSASAPPPPSQSQRPPVSTSWYSVPETSDQPLPWRRSHTSQRLTENAAHTCRTSEAAPLPGERRSIRVSVHYAV